MEGKAKNETIRSRNDFEKKNKKGRMRRIYEK